MCSVFLFFSFVVVPFDFQIFWRLIFIGFSDNYKDEMSKENQKISYFFLFTTSKIKVKDIKIIQEESKTVSKKRR